MKVLLSWLREFVDVREDADEIARVMSLRGFAVEGIERIGTEQTVIDFEVTGNRPDCMSVLGMAREIATAFQLPLKMGLAGLASMADSSKPMARRSSCEVSTIRSPGLRPRTARLPTSRPRVPTRSAWC